MQCILITPNAHTALKFVDTLGLVSINEVIK